MRTRTRSFIKLTIGAELRTQLVTSIKLRRGPANDNRDFRPVVKRAHRVKRIKVGIGDKGFDSEKNHELLRDELHAMSIIPARCEDVPVWRTRGRYRKEMKRGYSKKTYHQRSKDETVFSVIKRTMGDEVRSVGVKAQNNEMRLKIIAYNAARMGQSDLFLVRRVSTEPDNSSTTEPAGDSALMSRENAQGQGKDNYGCIPGETLPSARSTYEPRSSRLRFKGL